MTLQSALNTGATTALQSLVIPVEFDEYAHSYCLDSVPKPGVTSILRASNIGFRPDSDEGYMIDEGTLENARERGKNVALAMKLWLADDLDESSLDDDVAFALDKFKAWVDQAGFVCVLSEAALYSPEFDCCGSLDIAGWIGDDFWLLDAKNGGGGLKPWHEIQLAAYASMIKHPSIKRGVLDLKPSLKKAKVREFPTDDRYARSVFASARQLWTWRDLHGIPQF